MIAIFTTGIFNQSNYSTQQCVITSGFSCLSLFAGSDGTLLVNIQQATSTPINITAIGCNQNSMVTGINMLKFNTVRSQIFLPRKQLHHRYSVLQQQGNPIQRSHGKRLLRIHNNKLHK